MRSASEGEARPESVRFVARVAPWIITVSSVVAFAAAVVLLVEKLMLINDPSYVPTCSINPVLSCGSIMESDQAEAFGFPNPILGIAGFGPMSLFGVYLLLGGKAPRWLWLAAQAGATFAFGFVCWLIFQSLYRIEALCPYCMVVWLATFALFWYLSLANLTSGRIPTPAFIAPVVRFMVGFHGALLTGAVLVVVLMITEAFWDYWRTLL